MSTNLTSAFTKTSDVGVSGSPSKLQLSFTPDQDIPSYAKLTIMIPGVWNSEAAAADQLTHFVEPAYCVSTAGPAISCSLSGTTLEVTFATEPPANAAVTLSIMMKNSRLVENVSGIEVHVKANGVDIFTAQTFAQTGVTTASPMIASSIEVLGPAVVGSNAIIKIGGQVPFPLPTTAVLSVTPPAGFSLVNTASVNMGDYLVTTYPSKFHGKKGLLYLSLPVSLTVNLSYQPQPLEHSLSSTKTPQIRSTHLKQSRIHSR